VRTALDDADLGDPVSFVATLVLDEARLGRYLGEGPVNTDDRPYISFGDRLRSGTQTGIPAMMSLMPFYRPEGVERSLTEYSDRELDELQRRIKARRHTLLAGIALDLGDRARALEQARKALAVDPREPGARRILRRLRAG